MSRLLLTTVLWLTLETVSCNKLVCYYNREAATRGFTPANIDPGLCTHIVFGFAAVNNQNELTATAPTDKALFTELNNLKNSNANLKTLLAVGGSAFDNQKFSSMVASSNTRSSFITSVITFLQSNGFDGLNLDWRYPGDANSQPRDKDRFTSLCQELQTAFKAESPTLILSASVSADEALIDDSYEVALIAAALDFINVLTFSFHDTSSSVTAHHSPLGALSSNLGDTLTTEYAMNYWVTLGAPAAKLNMGFGAYGVAFRLADPTVSGPGAATSGTAEEGCYGGTPGIWSYYETCLYTQGGDLEGISDQSVPYAVTDGHWVGYDNTTSIDAKVDHLTAQGYGGMCVWALDLDDYTGQFCNAGINPFISHLKSKLSNIICNRKSGVHPNPTDNKSFFNCDHGAATLMSCSTGLVFKTSCNCCDHP